MKKILAVSAALILLLSLLVSCKDDGADSSGTVYGNRTQAFYGNMDQNSFYFSATVIDSSGAVYAMTQATNGLNVTTVIDFSGTTNDSYEIYHYGSDGKYVHQLDVSGKSYDTFLNRTGQDFIFAGYNHTMFMNLYSAGDEELNGEIYYCESFESAASSGGAASGLDKYYFRGDKLVAVVTSDLSLYFSDYSNDIPGSIYLEVPSGFKAGTLTEETEIEFSDFFGE